MVEHAGQERRVGGGLANRLGTDTCHGEEPAEALGIAGQKRKGLNREILGDFPGDARAFRHRRLPFRNVSPLGFY
jgi:hypothetical protein